MRYHAANAADAAANYAAARSASLARSADSVRAVIPWSMVAERIEVLQ